MYPNFVERYATLPLFSSNIIVELMAAYFLQVRRHMRLSPHEPAQQMVCVNDVVRDPDLTYQHQFLGRPKGRLGFRLKILKTATTRRHRNSASVHLDVSIVHGRMAKLYDDSSITSFPVLTDILFYFIAVVPEHKYTMGGM